MNEQLLMWLSLSFSGSVIAISLFLLRPLLQRLGRTWQYYLWLLVILRLLVPFGPERSVTGDLFQKAEAVWSRWQMAEESTAETDNADAGENYNMLPNYNLSASHGIPAESGMAALKNAAPQKAHAAFPVFSFLENHILGILWLTAAIGLLIRKIYGYGRFLKTVGKENQAVTDGRIPAVLREVMKEMEIKKNLSVCTNSFVTAPILTGIRRAAIVLPAGAVSETDLTNIFRHELTHFRRLDFLYKWLMELTVCLHWFNPVVYMVRRKLNQDCELSCDEAVIACLGDTERRAYGETLINSVAVKDRGRTGMAALSLGEDGKLLKDRLHAIMEYRRKSKSAVLIAAVFTCFLLCVTVFTGAYTVTAAENSNSEALLAPIQAISLKPGMAGKIGGIPTLPSDGKNRQTVVYENVEIRRYEGEDGHSYIHDISSNNTTMGITGRRRGMLAFDKDGNPLKIDWWSIDSELDSSWFYLYEDNTGVTAGATDDVSGGWSLNLIGNDTAAANIAYVLYCDKEITFEDGTVWENPDFENWRTACEGKKLETADLEGWYPFEQIIEF